jgi:hypothetical protein
VARLQASLAAAERATAAQMARGDSLAVALAHAEELLFTVRCWGGSSSGSNIGVSNVVGGADTHMLEAPAFTTPQAARPAAFVGVPVGATYTDG